MKKNVEFYHCTKCGNVVTKLVNAGTPLSCCGQEMELLKANTKDAAVEKHVPEFMKEEPERIQVGSVVHPMITEHYIQFIFATDGDICVYKTLTPDTEPSMTLDISKVDKSYEFCNIHGLWEGNK